MQGEPTIASKAKMFLDILNNEIVEAKYKIHHTIPIVMQVDAKVAYDNKWRTYCEIISQLEKQHGQTFYMLRVQCIQVLLDNMKHDPDWDTTSEYYDPLTLIKLIEKKYWLRPKTNIAMQQCTTKSVHCMASINKT